MRQHDGASVNTVAAQRRRQLVTARAQQGGVEVDPRWLSPPSGAGAVAADAADTATVTR
ncbi:hypothetical protein [Mycobacterium simiae]|uniref:hypothetical protein n=1 Tax=Mycobacterium simiae TaxID=1784 RepID=UPI001592F883|nr:hypothetical protein [Mycobacterium simiae]